MRPEPDHPLVVPAQILDYQRPLTTMDMFVRRDPMRPVAPFSFGFAVGAAISVAFGTGYLVYSGETQLDSLFASVIITFAVIWVESGFSLGLLIALRRAATTRPLTAVSERTSFLMGITTGPFLLPVSWFFGRFLSHSIEDVALLAVILAEVVTITVSLTMVRRLPVGLL
jgi:hypothetical protein